MLHSSTQTCKAFHPLPAPFFPQFVELCDSTLAERAVRQLHRAAMQNRYIEVLMSSEAEARQAYATLTQGGGASGGGHAPPAPLPPRMPTLPPPPPSHHEPSVAQWAANLGGSEVSLLSQRSELKREEPPPMQRDGPRRDDGPPPRRTNGARRSPPSHRRSPPPSCRSPPLNRRSPPLCRRSPPRRARNYDRRSPSRDRRRGRSPSSSPTPVRKKPAARRSRSSSPSPVRKKPAARRSRSSSPSPVRKKPAARRSRSSSPSPVRKKQPTVHRKSRSPSPVRKQPTKRPANPSPVDSKPAVVPTGLPGATPPSQDSPTTTTHTESAVAQLAREQEPTKDVRSQGTLRRWFKGKGYGFIDFGSDSIFVHVSDVQGVEEQELDDASLSKEGICLEFTKEFDEAKGKAIAKNVTRPSDLRSRMKERLAGGSGGAGQAQAPSSAALVSEVRVRTFEGQMAEKHKDPGVASHARPKASSDGDNDPQFGLGAMLKRKERFGQASSSTKVERAQELAEEKAKRAARFGLSKVVVDSSSGAKTAPVNESRSLEELSAAKSKSLSRASVPLQARSSASSGVQAHASSTEDPHCGEGAMLKRAERFGCSKVDGSGKMAQVTAAAPSGIGSSSGSGITMLSEPIKRSTSGRSSLDQRLADFVVARMQEQGSGSTEPLPQLASQLYKFEEQAKPHIRAKGGALRWCQGRPELRVFPSGHRGVAGCTVGLAPPSHRVKRSSTEPAASDGTKRARVDSGKSLTDRTGSTGTTPLSKREGKRPMAAQPLTVNPDGLVAMELSVRGEKEISTRRREMIEQKSGCRQEHVVGAKRFSVRGTALQLRHAAELLLKGATGTKDGVPELHVAANDDQAIWISGKDGGKLQ